jgi:hypothetical protein
MRCFGLGSIVAESQITEIQSGKRLVRSPETIQIDDHCVNQTPWNDALRHTIPICHPTGQQVAIFGTQILSTPAIFKLWECIWPVKPGNLNIAGPLPDASRRQQVSHPMPERGGNYTFD